MLTKRVRKLRKEYKEQSWDAKNKVTSNNIYDELIDNCKPTLEEFVEIASGLVGTARIMYRLAMDAPDKWK